MPGFKVKCGGSDKEYYVESDNHLNLFAALILFFRTELPIFITGLEDGEEAYEVTLYAPDKEGKDQTMNCDFEKYVEDHREEIDTIIGEIKEV